MKRILFIAMFCICFQMPAQLARIKLYKVMPGSIAGPSGVIYVSPTGSSSGTGSYASPYDWATAITFTNVYICRLTGCYTDFTPTLCITNPIEPPDLFTNSPVANYPMDYDVVDWSAAP